MQKNKLTNGFIIGTFVSLYVVVSLISTIHVIDFFKLSNPDWLAISLAIAFEIGAAASLAALIALKRMSKWMVWGVFILLAAMQMMGNTYYAFTHLHDFQGWSELFGLNEEELIFQKRILSIISGAILPLIALGFIKSLVDYIRPAEFKDDSDAIQLSKEDAKVFFEAVSKPAEPNEELKAAAKRTWKKVAKLKKEGKLPSDPTPEELADEPTALANSQYREAFTEQYLPENFVNDVELETASLVDLQEAMKEIEEEPVKVAPKEKKPRKPRKPKSIDDGLNPQVLPGVN
jgi:hypothetical protein